MKQHPFFYGVDWNTIRQIDAPFVPHLRSITDTSYFPTDELDQAPEEAPVADSSGGNKDLAFLGWVISQYASRRDGLSASLKLYLQAIPDLIIRVLTRIISRCMSCCSWSARLFVTRIRVCLVLLAISLEMRVLLLLSLLPGHQILKLHKRAAKYI